MSLDVDLRIKRSDPTRTKIAYDLLVAAGLQEIADDIAARHDVNDYELVYEANITHNLGQMAAAAGIYEHLWRPEEIGAVKAAQLIEPLTNGLELLRSFPERFKALEPENKWGTYDTFVPWIEKYLAACKEYPDAEVHACR
jgi:hypothetical protein